MLDPKNKVRETNKLHKARTFMEKKLASTFKKKKKKYISFFYFLMKKIWMLTITKNNKHGTCSFVNSFILILKVRQTDKKENF